MIADVLSVYGNEVAIHRKTAGNIAYILSSLLKWWGDKTVVEISTKNCRAFAATKSKAAAGQELKFLRAATNYWHKEYGPLNFRPVFWIPEANPPRDRWLTKNEAARLLQAARRSQHLRRMILLGLYTGSRPGVILALQWDQIDFRNGVMSRVRANVAEDTKKRAPKVKLGRRILTHLRRWHRIDGGQGFVCHYEGRQIADIGRSWDRAIREAGIDRVTPHVLRHTRATWMMLANVPIWEAAGFLGMTVKTLERVYGHHSPDHQELAANI